MNGIEALNFIQGVNFNITSNCNMQCRHCFGRFNEDYQTNLNQDLSIEEACVLIDKLYDKGFRKITFAGGEPLLCKWIDEAIKYASNKNMRTMLVTNGTLINESWLINIKNYLTRIALSIDSIKEETNTIIGRVSRNLNPTEDFYLSIINLLKKHNVNFKINTVVSSYNYKEDLSSFINKVEPEKWKILQALKVEGENCHEDLFISRNKFNSFISTNKKNLKNKDILTIESCDSMIGSYLMIDPKGRFFDNINNRHNYKKHIILDGLEASLFDVTFKLDNYKSRSKNDHWDEYREEFTKLKELEVSQIYEEIREKINISNIEIKDKEKEALIQLAFEPHGFEEFALKSLLSSILNISQNDAIDIFLTFKKYDLINSVEDRHFVDFRKFNIPIGYRDVLIKASIPYKNFQAPHSKQSMQSLDKIFEFSSEIFIFLEITSVQIFRKLDERVEKGLLTTFLIPDIKFIDKNRHQQYKTTIDNWKEYIKQDIKRKEFIRIKTVKKDFPELYTSLLGIDKARFAIYFFNNTLVKNPTLHGNILQVEKDTSLYKLIYERYNDSISNAIPLFSVWTREAIFYWTKKSVLPIVLISSGVLFASFTHPVATALFTIITGITTALFSYKIGKYLPINKKLF